MPGRVGARTEASAGRLPGGRRLPGIISARLGALDHVPAGDWPGLAARWNPGYRSRPASRSASRLRCRSPTEPARDPDRHTASCGVPSAHAGDTTRCNRDAKSPPYAFAHRAQSTGTRTGPPLPKPRTPHHPTPPPARPGARPPSPTPPRHRSRRLQRLWRHSPPAGPRAGSPAPPAASAPPAAPSLIPPSGSASAHRASRVPL